ncbi:MAG: type IV pilin protein [Elusimicrobiaceae bacterium]|nr:type IV pilin protein [Elusimicrobiaceae bacterium]
MEKSRATQALALLRTVAQAEENYFLANGSYTGRLDDLSVDVPWTGTEQWRSGLAGHSNGEWTLQLNASYGVYMGRLSGKYAGVGFVYLLSDFSTALAPYKGKIVCAERVGDGLVYQGSQGSYCGKVISISSQKIYDDGGTRMWLMP